MGGKLFNRGRIDREHYLDIETDIHEYLGDRYRIPRYYSNKPDFDDVVFGVRHHSCFLNTAAESPIARNCDRLAYPYLRTELQYQ
jgi:hypothetical protein